MSAGILFAVAAGCIACIAGAWLLMRWENRLDDNAPARFGPGRTQPVILRSVHVPELHELSPFPPIVPGRDTPAVHLTAIPPAVVPAAVTQFPAGGSKLPNRGDAQGRDVRVCATDSRPAPGADLTGSLSPRHLEESPGLVSAPPDPGTPDVPPAVVPAAVTHLPAGGSNPPAAAGQPENPSGDLNTGWRGPAALPRAAAAGDPGAGCLPEGDAPGSRPPQEAPAPGHPPGDGPLFPDWPTGGFAAVIDALGGAS